jgi:hypothetical protein
MTKLILAAACALSLIACKGGGATAAAPDCAVAIGKGVDAMLAANKDAPPEMVAIGAKLKGVLTKHCVEDKWPDAVVACMGNAASQPDMQKCRGTLSADQQAKVKADILQVMTGGAAAGK